MKPSHVTVIGCGAMGCDIAAIFLAKGCRVLGIAPNAAEWDEKRARVVNSLSQLKAKPQAVENFQLLTKADAAALQETELVIETVPERLDLKRQVFRDLVEVAPRDIPIVSNASGFRITDIMEGLSTAVRAAGLHFFLPAHLVPAVEVVRGEQTSDEIMDRVMSIMRAVGRVPVRVNKDKPGFLANRIQHALMREAFAVIDEGLASAEDVDAAVRFGFGFRYVAAGPIMQKELAGLDTQRTAAATIYPSLSQSTEPSRVLTELVAEGRHGVKTLHGFWKWTPEAVAAEKRRYEDVLLQALTLLDLTQQPDEESSNEGASA